MFLVYIKAGDLHGGLESRLQFCVMALFEMLYVSTTGHNYEQNGTHANNPQSGEREREDFAVALENNPLNISNAKAAAHILTEALEQVFRPLSANYFTISQNFPTKEKLMGNFEYTPAKADGNCFFHSVALAFGYGIQDSVYKGLRRDATNYLSNNPDFSFLPPSTIALSGQDGKWAEMPSVMATAKILNVCIRVFRIMGNRNVVEEWTATPDGHDISKCDTTSTINLINWNDIHFDALLPKLPRI